MISWVILNPVMAIFRQARFSHETERLRNKAFLPEDVCHNSLATAILLFFLSAPMIFFWGYTPRGVGSSPPP
jgi:hypothetical protein